MKYSAVVHSLQCLNKFTSNKTCQGLSLHTYKLQCCRLQVRDYTLFVSIVAPAMQCCLEEHFTKPAETDAIRAFISLWIHSFCKYCTNAFWIVKKFTNLRTLPRKGKKVKILFFQSHFSGTSSEGLLWA